MRADKLCLMCILQARGVDTSPRLVLSTSERFVRFFEPQPLVKQPPCSPSARPFLYAYFALHLCSPSALPHLSLCSPFALPLLVPLLSLISRSASLCSRALLSLCSRSFGATPGVGRARRPRRARRCVRMLLRLRSARPPPGAAFTSTERKTRRGHTAVERMSGCISHGPTDVRTD